MIKEKSFTLIELLVVIAIIGLIASVVLVNVGGLQGKARLTKTLEFSSSINNALGAYMVGYWSFDDQASPTKDGSGYNNHGTLVNAPTFNSDTPYAAVDRGTGRSSLSFNGSNQYVMITDSSSLDIGTNDFTIEAWVKRDTFNVWHVIVRKDNAAQTTGYELYLPPDNKLTLYIKASSYQSTGTITDSNWHHVVVSADRDGNAAFYIDGKSSGTSNIAASAGDISNSFNLGIGSTGAGGGDYFDGLIDEVRIYEKALVLGQVQQLYAAGLEGHQNLAIK